MNWKDRLNLMLTERSGGSKVPKNETPAARAARVASREAESAARKKTNPQAKQPDYMHTTTPYARRKGGVLATRADSYRQLDLQRSRRQQPPTTTNTPQVEARTDWKDRLMALVLETVGRVKNYYKETTTNNHEKHS